MDDITTATDYTVRELTPDLLPAFDDLFDTTGPVGRCWCMYWRIGPEYRRRDPEVNRGEFHEVVNAGPPPGLLAMAGERAVGWCQITPRTSLSWLDDGGRIPRIDDAAVWSISCFYVRKGHRREGVSEALISGALDTARRAGAPAVEGYPLDAAVTPSSSHTGYRTTFERLGFSVVGGTPSQPTVRFDLVQTM